MHPALSTPGLRDTAPERGDEGCVGGARIRFAANEHHGVPWLEPRQGFQGLKKLEGAGEGRACELGQLSALLLRHTLPCSR